MRRTLIFCLLPLLSSSTFASSTVNYHRLGWLTAQEIAALPEDQPRPEIAPACHGAWLTPIPSTVKLSPIDASPVQAEANWLYYDPNGISKLRGSVHITQTGRLILADEAELTSSRDKGSFSGNILVAEPGIVLTGEHAKVNMADNSATIDSSEFVYTTTAKPVKKTTNSKKQNTTLTNAHGRATQIERHADATTDFASVEYSACEPDHRVWYFSAKKLHIDPSTGRGTVQDASIHIGDVPIIYLPYFNFPVDDRRQSGLLVPRFGTTNDGGLDFAQPIYWNIAPNYDATITPRLLSRRGLMAEGEFRYLTAKAGQGELNGAFLPSDSQYDGLDRKRATWKHQQRSQQWRVSSNVNYVSDKAYFSDLGTDFLQSNTTHQERTGEVEYYGNRWSLLSRVQSYQTIDPTLTDISKPYARLPQILFNGSTGSYSGLQGKLLTELTHFQRSINDGSGVEVNGLRWRIEPQVSYELNQPWGFVKPSLGWRQLSYELDQQGHHSLQAPKLSVDSGLIFEREQGHYLHTLEPRIYYLFSPYHNQDNLPNFDTAATTFSYAQLFRASRFSGGDRLDDANQLSIGLTSRWLDQNDGSERLRLSAGQIFYLRDRKVLLNSSDPIATSNVSGIAGEAASQINQDWSASLDGLWTADGDTGQISAQAHYLPPNSNQLFNIGYTFRREVTSLNQKSLRQTSTSIIRPLNVNWRVLALLQYDLQQQAIQDSLFGVQYDACCWRLSMYRRQYLIDSTDVADNKRSAFFIEFALKGLAGLSSSVNQLLKNRVYGYSQLQDTTTTPVRGNP